jgi:hypothetical protein
MARLLVAIRAGHEKMVAELDAHRHKRMTAKMKAHPEERMAIMRAD